jgi:hypothetical protein
VHQVLPFALFVGTAMSVIAFPVLARILTDRGMHRTRIVLSAVSHGMSAYPRPERMRNGGEFVAVRVLSGASRTRHAPRAARDLQRSLVVCRSA